MTNALLTRDELLKHMAMCCVAHLTPDERTLVTNVALNQTERFYAYLVLARGPFTPREFASHALQCARRVQEGAAS